MIVIGHRGASGYEPESTLRSFKKALDLGADMIEFDIHRLRSGELVVIHDHTVNRTTNGSGHVSNYNLAALKKLDAGLGEKIPTLNEALDLIIGRAKVNIEIKGDNVAEELAKIIQQRKIYSQVLVSSFLYNQLWEVKKLDQLIPLAMLSDEYRLAPYLEMSKDLSAREFNAHLTHVDEQFVKTVQAAGLKLNVFTVNRTVDVERMLKLGVDGVFTDYPDRALNLINNQKV